MGSCHLISLIPLLILLHLPPLVLPLTFDYASMDNSAAEYLTETGNVSFTPQFVELTWFDNNPMSCAGRVYNQEQLSLWDSNPRQAASFNCSFAFAIALMDDVTPADGLAFFLLDPSVAQIPEGSKGGWLALLNTTTNGTASAGVVAVEFDTFENSWDPSSNHVGININSISSSSYSNLTFALTTSSAVYAWVDYSGSQSLLEVYATNVSADKPSSPLISQSMELTQILPENVFVGFSAATGLSAEYHRILSWSFNSTPVAAAAPSPSNHPYVVGASAGSAALVIVVCVLLLLRCRRKKRPGFVRQDLSGIGLSSSDINYGPSNFNYTELRNATHNFGEDTMLGEGAFGSVHKGVSPLDGSAIAVKRISQKSTQGEKEFFAELSIISSIRHKNLVQLKGWCREQRNLLLVYEYLPNGSLDQRLFSNDPSSILSWSKRYDIMCGLGSALQYLHQECEKVIVHRDIKPSNVMLDANYNAKLGDFGMARRFEEGAGGRSTIAAGTFGYMAPETLQTERATTESDVYSYGMVLLEVVCGRRPVQKDFPEQDEVILLNWVWGLHSQGRLREAADARLDGAFDEEQLVRALTVGLACAHPDSTQRPHIALALAALEGRSAVPDVPASKPVPYYGPLPPFTSLFSSHSISISDTSCGCSSSAAANTDASEKALLN